MCVQHERLDAAVVLVLCVSLETGEKQKAKQVLPCMCVPCSLSSNDAGVALMGRGSEILHFRLQQCHAV
jgi:hypothetical protein